MIASSLESVLSKEEKENPAAEIKDEKSFWNTLWGALQGEFNEDPTGTQILIDMGINFIPGVGQVCDARDIAACLKKLVIEKRVDEIMIWVTLLLTAIGCVPYAGDVIKAGCKAILKGADDVVLKILRKLDADDVQKAVKILKTKFTSSIDDAIAMVNKWIEHAGNSKYGNRIKGILSSTNENLNKAIDFVKKQIDEFEEKVFGRGKKRAIAEKSGKRGNWNTKLNKKLEPNKLYKVDDYSYLTDKSGRVSKVSGELKLETKDRNMYQQRKAVEIKDGVKGEDQGGHLIARIFNGPGEQINYIPQNAKLNNGKWRAMENEWKKELKAGKKVEVEIQIIYDNKNFSKRPQKFVVNTTTTDSLKRVEYSTYEFYN